MRSTYVSIASAVAGVALLGAIGAFATIVSASTAPTTNAATAVTSTDATLNGTNGDTAATDSSFWVSTSTFSTASSTPPAGVYSTPDLGAQGANASFSAALSSAVGMPAVTPDTTYFFAAWSSTDGGTTWNPGAVMSFTTSAAATSTPAAPTVTGIAPTSGSTAGGTAVTITGTGFTGATAVDFGSTPATITATTSDTSITATSPVDAIAGPVDVTVTTPNGTSATSSADRFTYTAPATSTAPVISNVAVSDIGTSTAMVTWNTDQASVGDVAYGTTTAYGSTTALETSATTTHSATLSALSGNTLYHFQVSAGNGTATSTSADMTFSTASSSLAIDNTTSIQSSGVADNTFADGWEWDVNFSIPVTQNAFRIRFSDWGNASSSFPTADDVQIWSPQSTNATSSSSAILETGNGYSGWLYFPTGTNDIDVMVNVKIPFGTANGSYSSDFTAETYPSTATSTAI
jgi:IPT/TIG domain